MQAHALSVTVAWLRLERANADYARHLRAEFGVTPLQLSILAILSERPALPLAALRKALVMHAATLGQAVDDMRRAALVTVKTNPEDRRARVVAISGKGLELLERAPTAGPVRLRDLEGQRERLDRMRDALNDGVELFGLGPWLPEVTDGR